MKGKSYYELDSSFVINILESDPNSFYLQAKEVGTLISKKGKMILVHDNREESIKSKKIITGKAFMIVEKGTYDNFDAIYLYLHDLDDIIYQEDEEINVIISKAGIILKSKSGKDVLGDILEF